MIVPDINLNKDMRESPETTFTSSKGIKIINLNKRITINPFLLILLLKLSKDLIFFANFLSKKSLAKYLVKIKDIVAPIERPIMITINALYMSSKIAVINIGMLKTNPIDEEIIMIIKRTNGKPIPNELEKVSIFWIVKLFFR